MFNCSFVIVEIKIAYQNTIVTAEHELFFVRKLTPQVSQINSSHIAESM